MENILDYAPFKLKGKSRFGKRARVVGLTSLLLGVVTNFHFIDKFFGEAGLGTASHYSLVWGFEYNHGKLRAGIVAWDNARYLTLKLPEWGMSKIGVEKSEIKIGEDGIIRPGKHSYKEY